MDGKGGGKVQYHLEESCPHSKCGKAHEKKNYMITTKYFLTREKKNKRTGNLERKREELWFTSQFCLWRGWGLTDTGGGGTKRKVWLVVGKPSRKNFHRGGVGDLTTKKVQLRKTKKGEDCITQTREVWRSALGNSIKV